MALFIKCLPHKCSFNPQNPVKKLGAVSHTCNSTNGKMGVGNREIQ